MPRGKSSKKEQAPRVPKPAYMMPGPNSDIEAYGWDMSKLRYPNPESESKRDPDPGKPIFTAPEATWENRQRYGHNIDFLCPQYIQLFLDRVDTVRDAALAAHEAGYTDESVKKIQDAINTAFTKKILPEIAKNFGQISEMLAQFYAARVAHIKKFGKT